jgi:tetratricopeptide (TPR) repeat protein
MPKKISVFISSKMQELRDEREALADLLPTLGNDNFELEAWVFEQDALASDQSIREVFINALDDSDLYIGIFWNQYGEWTIDEFRRAGELGLPRHIYVKNVDAEQRDARLARFLEKESDVRFGITPRWYQTLDEFKALVTRSIKQWLTDREIAYHSSTNALIATIGDDVPDLPRRLIGRKRLIAQVTRLLEDHERVLLRGFGGMGKTALAATIAANYVDEGHGDVIWVRAGSVTADGIFDAIGRAFDQQQAVLAADGTAREQVVRHILAKHKGLLVLDDAWNGSALTQVLRALPRRMPLLVTSRQRFPLDEVVEVGELDADEALKLLEYHARVDYSEDADARELCHLLGNHAFALEIAGKTLKVYQMSAEELLKRIEEAPHDLSMPAGFGDLGRQGIKSLLDASIDALNRDLYDAYVAMGGLLEATATTELVALTLQKEAPAVDTALQELVQRGLMNPREQGGIPYYQLHDLGYSYARNIFMGQTTTTTVDILDAYRQYVQRHVDDLPYLDVEYNAILEAAEVALQHQHGHLLIDIMKALAMDGMYFAARGHTLRSVSLMRESIARAISDGAIETAHYLASKLGNAYANFLGDLDEALSAYQRALELARNMQNRQREAILLTVIGTVQFRLGQAGADDYHRQAETIAQEIGNDNVRCQVLLNRGTQALNDANPNPDYELGRDLCQQAAELADTINNEALRFWALLNMGAAEHEMGDHEMALLSHLQAYNFARAQRNHPWEAEALYSLGEDYHELGQRAEAEKHLNLALKRYKESGVKAKVESVTTFIVAHDYRVQV